MGPSTCTCTTGEWGYLGMCMCVCFQPLVFIYNSRCSLAFDTFTRVLLLFFSTFIDALQHTTRI